MTREAPVARVRARVAALAGAEAAEAIPDGYQRLGRVLVVKLPEALRPHFSEIGQVYLDELHAGAVLRRRGPIVGDWRVPDAERIAGGDTRTEVLENGVRYAFDAARIMFSEGNRRERARVGELVEPGEVVVDLFAGIGYFALAAAREGRASLVYACEANPESYRCLEANAARNRVARRLRPLLGDNRSAGIPRGCADRVFLGLLPSALPWVDRALELVRPEGGWLHVHSIVGARGGIAEAVSRTVAQVVAAGGTVVEARGREVKPYGPGRLHAVVDVRVRPRG